MTPTRPDEPASPDSGKKSIHFPEPAEATPIQVGKRRAGIALRRLIDGLIMRHPELDEINALADTLERLADGFADMPEKATRSSFADRITPEDVRDFIEFSPITGHSNPVAPPLDLWVENGRVFGKVNFGRSFEGAPGLVHGGHVAAIFDELLGFTQGLSKQPGMTGTLTIVYRSPTPLLTDLRMEGDYEGMEGRKIYTSGKLFAGDRLLAEAKGLFIALTEAQHDAVLQMRENLEQR